MKNYGNGIYEFSDSNFIADFVGWKISNPYRKIEHIVPIIVDGNTVGFLVIEKWG